MTDLSGRLAERYRRLPHHLRARLPAGLRGWVKARLAPDLDRPRTRTKRFETLLWGGFSRPALAGLARMKQDAAPAAAAEAARVLARWRAVAGDFDAALENMAFLRATDPAAAAAPRAWMLEALFLVRLGRGPEARALIEARLGGHPPEASAALLLSSACNPAAGGADPDAALGHLDGVFAAAGLAGVASRIPGVLGFDDLAAAAPVAPVFDPDGRVSVIVPAHNAAATLPTALRGLLGQSWRNLEVLVVDDASTDATAEVATAFAATDPRVRLIRQTVNGGSYAARNRGLAEATGTYVTVHDADDWSHPEKIRLHVADLRARDLPFNLSAWVRASDDLVFWGPWRPTDRMLVRNLSSAFFRRDLVARIGPWDTARISADREFINRMQTIFGLPRQEPFLPETPLAFGRATETSITATKATHVASQYHGLRRDYGEACDVWHADLDGRAILRDGLRATPPFCVSPASIRSRRADEPPLDLLFIGDFNFSGGTFHSAMNMTAAARAAGRRVGLVHYRRHDQDVTRPLKPEVRRFADEGGIRLVSAGEAVTARTAIVTYPPIFQEPLDRFPEIACEHVVVVVNQMAERDRGGGDVAYDPLRVRAHLVELLGSEGLWAPISEYVRALMAADPRYPAPLADTWTPLIDTDTWCARAPVWRGGARATPVIGRHGRDHPLKWPADPAELASAYCANRPCEVRFLGGARHARARLRRWPANWREEPFGSRDVREFLGDLDFFLHYPDPASIEAFGRAPMEAMAVGVPVILPPEFAPTFGDAALYAAPDEVWPMIAALWRDEAAWRARAALGRAFVETRCSRSAFTARVARIENAASLHGRPAATPA